MSITLNGTDGITFPTWTTGTRPASPAQGQAGYNTTIGAMETYTGSAWVSSDLPTGFTTNTFTSLTTNFTLTASSNQVQKLQGDTTASNGPSITLPAMNSSMSTGNGRFVFTNASRYDVALKDSGGTIREFIPALSNNVNLTIGSTASANGFWYTQAPNQDLVGVVATLSSSTNQKQNSTYNFGAYGFVSLDSTHFAIVWSEQSPGTAGSLLSTYAIYAQLFTVSSTAPYSITANNRLTVSASSNKGGAPFEFAWDTDNAGHALCLFVGADTGVCSNYAMGGSAFGLSVSSNTLYATAVQSFTYATASGATPNNIGIAYIGYLGSNSAYAYGINVRTEGSTNGVGTYFYGCTITGTTTPTFTASASNTSATGTSAVVPGWVASGSRTGLTTFTSYTFPINTNLSIARAVSYTPASNTFTVATRTNTSLLATETAALLASTNTSTFPVNTGFNSYGAKYSSFGQGGFAYNSGAAKILFGDYAFDITNAGAAGVTTTLTSSVNIKSTTSTSYEATTFASYGFTATRSSVYSAGTQYFAGGGGTLDVTNSNWNINGLISYSGNTSVLLSSTASAQLNLFGSPGYAVTLFYQATPLTPV